MLGNLFTNHHVFAILAQNNLLSHFIRSTYEVKTSSNSVNYVEFRRSSDDAVRYHGTRKEKVLVLAHGFGLGLGFFFDNYDHLLDHFDRIIAVDWLGMGCSGRTAKEVTLSQQILNWRAGKSKAQIAQGVHNELVDSLESLCHEENISDFVLAGHSLGGYLAAKYAVRYPNRVQSLILISPAGIGSRPKESEQFPLENVRWPIRVMEKMWRYNITPQVIIRMLGNRWGQNLVTSTIQRRFSRKWSPTELELLSKYLFHISAAPGNGEYALTKLLEPLTVALKPHELESAKRGYHVGIYAVDDLTDDLNYNLKMPLLLIYGEDDWLRYPELESDVQRWVTSRKVYQSSSSLSPSSIASSSASVTLKIVSKAGHHLYLDNPREFNQTVVDWLKMLER